jgi:hypothetical protein
LPGGDSVAWLVELDCEAAAFERRDGRWRGAAVVANLDVASECLLRFVD